MTALGIETDDEITVTYPAEGVERPDRPDRPDRPPWSPPAQVVVDLTIPDGVKLVLRINGDQLMPEYE